MQKLLLMVDKLSTRVGQAFSWLILARACLVSWEVLARYILVHPHTWSFAALPMV